MSQNAFESGARKAIPAVLIYARHRHPVQGDQVLMIHRNSAERPADYHAGKWNGLGGKCEADESPLETARREFHEEAGVDLSLEKFRSLGVLTFPNFKAHKNEDWIVFVYAVEMSDADVARVVSGNAEGSLHWVPASDLTSLNLWPGDRHFIGHVASGQPFVGTIWYQGQEVLRHEIRRLG